MQVKHPNKRPSILSRKFIIMPKFQYFIILQVLLLFGFIILATFGIEKVLINNLIYENFTQEMTFATIMENIEELKQRMNYMFVYKICLFFLISTLWGVVISHRIAGPIYRIKKSLDAYVNGEENLDLKFRKDDYFHDLAESINKAIKK